MKLSPGMDNHTWHVSKYTCSKIKKARRLRDKNDEAINGFNGPPEPPRRNTRRYVDLSRIMTTLPTHNNHTMSICTDDSTTTRPLPEFDVRSILDSGRRFVARALLKGKFTTSQFHVRQKITTWNIDIFRSVFNAYPIIHPTESPITYPRFRGGVPESSLCAPTLPYFQVRSLMLSPELEEWCSFEDLALDMYKAYGAIVRSQEGSFKFITRVVAVLDGNPARPPGDQVHVIIYVTSAFFTSSGQFLFPSHKNHTKDYYNSHFDTIKSYLRMRVGASVWNE